MKISHMAGAVRAFTEAGRNVIFEGPPGIGKTEGFLQAASASGADVIISHPVTDDPTDYKGFPFRSADETHAVFLPFDKLWQAISAKRLTYWLFDDMGQATPATGAALMQVVQGGLNGYKSSKHVRFVATTNRQKDRAGVNRILTPLANRFCWLSLDLHMKDWLAWSVGCCPPGQLGKQRGILEEIRSFIKFKGDDALLNFDPNADERAFASPRAWHILSDVMWTKPHKDLLPEIVRGTVGKGLGTEFLAFRNTAAKLPDLNAIKKSPEKVPVPDEPDILCALAGGLVSKMRAEDEFVEAFVTYSLRMPLPITVFSFRDALAIRPELLTHSALCAWVEENKDLFLDE